MSRFVRAWNELTGGRQSKSMLPSTPRNMSGNQIVSRDTVNPISPYESSSYNSPIGNTAAPPGSRQQWELHKVREESRNLFLRSPLWSAYVHFMRMQVRGFKPTRLRFRRMTREQKGRLKEVCKFLRQDWDMFQSIRGVFGTGRNIHQSAGNALHHMLVDGDCFLTNRLMAGKRVWDLHPGDSLYEQFNQNFGDGNYVQMGVEMDAHAMPCSTKAETEVSATRFLIPCVHCDAPLLNKGRDRSLGDTTTTISTCWNMAMLNKGRDRSLGDTGWIVWAGG